MRKTVRDERWELLIKLAREGVVYSGSGTLQFDVIELRYRHLSIDRKGGPEG